MSGLRGRWRDIEVTLFLLFLLSALGIFALTLCVSEWWKVASGQTREVAPTMWESGS